MVGLQCPDSIPGMHLHKASCCLVCMGACNSFPVESVIVIDFECDGSFEYNNDEFDFDKIYSLDVCITKTQVESIVETRTRGCELLRSMARFLQLLGQGSRTIVVTEECRRAIEDGEYKLLYVVKYSKEEKDDIQIFARDALFDVTKLPSCKLTNAIMRSFAEDKRDPIPNPEQCYISYTAFHFLRHELGLPIDEMDFLNNDECETGQLANTANYNWRFY